MSKYIFVTGGVTSSLGKGIVGASLGKLLQARGLNVTIQKFDPYINVDPGTLNPYEHGECYVTDDGAETDLDLGHYERFLNIPTSQANNVTTGRIYQTVINKERTGDYLGKTVQVIPHITDEIKRRMRLLEEKNFDIIITELGGTVGDIESLPYLEALRQLRMELAPQDHVTVHLTLIPYLAAAKELKTKPTQHSVKELQEAGIQPDILVCRTEKPLGDDIRSKLALFCNLTPDRVIEAIDADTIYDVPLLMLKENLDIRVMEKLQIQNRTEPNLTTWKTFLGHLKNPTEEVKIGLIGKYNELPDAYKSIYEAFVHAGAENECKVKVHAVHSEDILNDNDAHKLLKDLDGILVAPGFGERGIDGKILAIKYARTKNIPFFGICLGMQCAVVEFARNVLKLTYASSTEVNKDTADPVIHMMVEQRKIKNKGGTMRLGAYACDLKENSKVAKAYQQLNISERHRHRFEFNETYKDAFESKGMIPVGINSEKNLVEIVELKNHLWFVGVQFHPELKSTVENPHPLFVDFIKHSILFKKNGNHS